MCSVGVELCLCVVISCFSNVVGGSGLSGGSGGRVRCSLHSVLCFAFRAGSVLLFVILLLARNWW